MHRFALPMAVALVVALAGACGANPDDTPKQSLSGTTLFQAADDVEAGAPKIDAIIQQGADVNAKDAEGLTALHHAAQADNGNAVKRLLSNAADPTIQDGQGRTAMDIAVAAGAQSAIRELERRQ